jgi:hypothetical protein
MSEEGQTSLLDFKFQRSYCSPDMSGPKLDMTEKRL